MPQLTIPGFGAEFEEIFENAYQKSLAEGRRRRATNEKSGSALTIDEQSPACDGEWALRDPEFGSYEPAHLACGFVQGFGAGLGPHVIGMPTIDYLIWFLSSESDWLPGRIHTYLLKGMKDWIVWPNWHDQENWDLGYRVDFDQSLSAALYRARGVRSFMLTAEAEQDLRQRIAFSTKLQQLPEEPSTLYKRF